MNPFQVRLMDCVCRGAPGRRCSRKTSSPWISSGRWQAGSSGSFLASGPRRQKPSGLNSLAPRSVTSRGTIAATGQDPDTPTVRTSPCRASRQTKRKRPVPKGCSKVQLEGAKISKPVLIYVPEQRRLAFSERYHVERRIRSICRLSEGQIYSEIGAALFSV